MIKSHRQVHNFYRLLIDKLQVHDYILIIDIYTREKENKT